MVFLRARWYSVRDGRFASQDPWPGSIQQPPTLHKYAYVLNNPTNYTDPTGQFHPDFIEESLAKDGLSVDVFGDYDRWGLYALLLDAKWGYHFAPLYLDFASGPQIRPWPLVYRGSWQILPGECLELTFFSPEEGVKSLSDLIWWLELEGSSLSTRTNTPWRKRTLELHWYHMTGNQYYSDFGEKTEVPDVLIVSRSQGAGGVFGTQFELAVIHDRYGNRYRQLSAGFNWEVGVSLPFFVATRWEGYAYRWGSDRQLSESELKELLVGINPTISGNYGYGYSWDFQKEGYIHVFGGMLPSIGTGLSVGRTVHISKSGTPWNWIDSEIPGYDSRIQDRVP